MQSNGSHPEGYEFKAEVLEQNFFSAKVSFT
jgi:hypothetical protein